MYVLQLSMTCDSKVKAGFPSSHEIETHYSQSWKGKRLTSCGNCPNQVARVKVVSCARRKLNITRQRKETPIYSPSRLMYVLNLVAY